MRRCGKIHHWRLGNEASRPLVFGSSLANAYSGGGNVQAGIRLGLRRHTGLIDYTDLVNMLQRSLIPAPHP